jgi:hypothetical protein
LRICDRWGSSHISSIATPSNDIVQAVTQEEEEGEEGVVLAVVAASGEGAEETAWLEKSSGLRRV